MTMNWRRTISTLAAALPLAASVHAYGTTAPVGSTTDNAVDVHSTARYSLADTGKVAGGAVAQYHAEADDVAR